VPWAGLPTGLWMARMRSVTAGVRTKLLPPPRSRKLSLWRSLEISANRREATDEAIPRPIVGCLSSLTRGDVASIDVRRTSETKAMTMRTTETTISFRHSFSLTAVDSAQPAGTYRLVTDEEEILGVSFVALRRAATMLHTPAISSGGRNQVFLVDPAELAAALEADSRT